MINLFRHLLPKGKAWILTISKQLRVYFEGLASWPNDVKTFADDIYGDINPQTTRQIPEWEKQFGIVDSGSTTTQERRDRLAGQWSAVGGQSPRYIQDVLQTTGFPVYVHDWWGPALLTAVERSNPAALALYAITYGEGLFIAVGTAGADAYIITSGDNGATWTERSNPAAVPLYGITYDGAQFVAVGAVSGDAYIITSPDGITWTERANTATTALYDVIYAGGQFVAVGAADATDAAIFTSPDGITWAEQSNPKAFALAGVTYDGSQYIAVGDADGTNAYIVTSPDGITWTERDNPKNFTLNGVTFGNGLIIAVGAADGTDAYIITSPDGITWTEQSNNRNVTLSKITYSNGLFIAVGDADGTGAYYLSSEGGTIWYEWANPQNLALYGVAAYNGAVVAVGNADATDAYIITDTIFDATRNPFAYVQDTRTYYIAEAGESDAQCGESTAECDRLFTVDGNLLVNIPDRSPVMPADTATYPYYMYIGGEEYGTFVNIDADRRTEFESLILKIKPGHQWCGLLINYI